MNRRVVRILVAILVTAQVLLGAPVVNARAHAATAAAPGETHCADMMAGEMAGEMSNAGDAAEPCPCCPDGATDMSSCFSQCFAMPGAAPGFAPAPARQIFAAPAPRVSIPPATLAEPPLKPPPIA